MKIIFTLIAFSLFNLAAKPVNSNSFTGPRFGTSPCKDDKKEEIRIESNRKSGDMQLRFTTDKEGEAIITILNEAGKIVLQQTNQVASCINIIPLINAISLAEGSYTVRIISNDETYSTRFLIWK